MVSKSERKIKKSESCDQKGTHIVSPTQMNTVKMTILVVGPSYKAQAPSQLYYSTMQRSGLTEHGNILCLLEIIYTVVKFSIRQCNELNILYRLIRERLE